jgi:hypothetical protein
MLLFFGEHHISGAELIKPQAPQSIGDSDWKRVSSANITIQYCDFSPAQDQNAVNEARATAISGNPVLESKTVSKSRQLNALGESLLADRNDIIKTANGVFCGFALDLKENRLKLFTDYLGLRKIFFARFQGRILFANTQWLIERLLPKDSLFDEQAIIEMGVLGHALDNRTRRQDVELLAPGSILTVDKNGELRVQQFCKLTEIEPSKLSEKEALEAIHNAWNNAVAARITHENPLSFLSGGMDSRLLVHTLKAFGTVPNTANFAPPQTMDRVFAESAAREIGVPLWLHPTGSLNIDFVTDTVQSWTQSSVELATAFKDRTIWSGDGGSVGLGNVYLDDETNQLCRAGAYDECARRFCQNNKRIPVARAYRRKNVREQFEYTIAQLLKGYGQTQADRAPYFFLMLNDQRHHLDHHYETIHHRKFDFELPFFDRRLIELTASLPVREFNFHRMYDRLFHKIGGTLTSTPWQTYPGHVACSLPKPKNLAYQWSNGFYKNSQKNERRRSYALRTFYFAIRPATKQMIFNKRYIAIASITSFLGLSDHSHLYKAIEPML